MADNDAQVSLNHLWIWSFEFRQQKIQTVSISDNY